MTFVRRGAIALLIGCTVAVAAVLPSRAVADARGTQWLSHEHPAVAFDGSNFLVVWENTLSAHGLSASRVTPDGVVLDPNGLPIEPSSYAASPVVTFGAGNYLVGWAGQGGGRAAR